MDVRKKIRDACDPCRSRKIKCSGNQPSCSHCRRLGLNCVYSQARRVGRPRRASGTERTTTLTSPLPDAEQGATGVSSVIDSGPTVVRTGGLDSLTIGQTENAHQPFSSGTASFAAVGYGGSPLDTQTRDWTHWFDMSCMLQHPPLAPIDGIMGSGQDPPTRDDEARGCDCIHAISRYFTDGDETNRGLSRFNSLRDAIALADRVLLCRVCFNVKDREAYISKHIVLLGALMSDIAMSYGRLGQHLYQRALQPCHENSTVDILLGQQHSDEAPVAMSIDVKGYWTMVKGALMGDLARLSSLCNQFEARQLRAHELGHEDCLAGSPCTFDQARVSSAIARYVRTCPRSVDPRKAFSCFRTVHQVSSAIQEAQNIIDFNATY